VRLLTEASTDDLDFIINTKCIEQAIDQWDIRIMRTLLEHMLLLRKGLHPTHMGSGRSLQATQSEKFDLGALLSKKYETQPKNRGRKAPLNDALYKAVDRKDLAMAKFLLGYGASDAHIIRSAAARHWLEGIRLLASQKGLVTLEDIIFAYDQADTSVGNLLLSLNPSFATHLVTSHGSIWHQRPRNGDNLGSGFKFSLLLGIIE
jgi:hypothetical protein